MLWVLIVVVYFDLSRRECTQVLRFDAFGSLGRDGRLLRVDGRVFPIHAHLHSLRIMMLGHGLAIHGLVDGGVWSWPSGVC